MFTQSVAIVMIHLWTGKNSSLCSEDNDTVSHIVLSELASKVKVVCVGVMKALEGSGKWPAPCPSIWERAHGTHGMETGWAQSQSVTLDKQQKSLAPTHNQTTISQSSSVPVSFLTVYLNHLFTLVWYLIEHLLQSLILTLHNLYMHNGTVRYNFL
jgi:hypothetical protein